MGPRDEGNDAHGLPAAGTCQRLNLEKAAEQLGPTAAGLAERDGDGRGVHCLLPLGTGSPPDAAGA